MDQSIPQLGAVYLPVAFALGALHAFEPGHGKTLASAYLVSGDHDWRDALVLGAATTLAHTGVVILLAVGGYWASGYLPMHGIEHAIGLLGAALLIGMGAVGALGALRDLRHGHSHHHHHHHGEPDHEARRRTSLWSVAMVGASNGLLPCPGAMAALVFALCVGKVGQGLATVLVYSLGLAATLVAIGVVAIEAGRRAKAWLPSDRALLWLPLASAVIIMASGLWMLAAPAHHAF